MVKKPSLTLETTKKDVLKLQGAFRNDSGKLQKSSFLTTIIVIGDHFSYPLPSSRDDSCSLPWPSFGLHRTKSKFKKTHRGIREPTRSPAERFAKNCSRTRDCRNLRGSWRYTFGPPPELRSRQNLRWDVLHKTFCQFCQLSPKTPLRSIVCRRFRTWRGQGAVLARRAGTQH